MERKDSAVSVNQLLNNSLENEKNSQGHSRISAIRGAAVDEGRQRTTTGPSGAHNHQFVTI